MCALCLCCLLFSMEFALRTMNRPKTFGRTLAKLKGRPPQILCGRLAFGVTVNTLRLQYVGMLVCAGFTFPTL